MRPIQIIVDKNSNIGNTNLQLIHENLLRKQTELAVRKKTTFKSVLRLLTPTVDVSFLFDFFVKVNFVCVFRSIRI